MYSWIEVRLCGSRLARRLVSGANMRIYTHAVFTLKSQSLSQWEYWSPPACQWHLWWYNSLLMLHQNVVNAHTCSNGTCAIFTPSMGCEAFLVNLHFENFSFISLGINPCKFSHKCSLPSSLPDWAVTVWGEWLANKNYHLKMVWHACIWFSMSECSGGMKGTLVF